MTPVEVTRGHSPVLLGLPHTGTHVPEEIRRQLLPLGQMLADTDWHIHQLYDGPLGDLLENLADLALKTGDLT